MRTAMTWLGSFVLDFRLALRLLGRYPLLTIVGGVAMALGLAAGVAGLEVRTQMVDPRLPLDEGHRIVGLRNWDIRRDRPGSVSEADFSAWRERLHRVQDLSAIVLTERNLTVDGSVEPTRVAEITASGFRVARVQPLLGRSLLEADEDPGAPPVSVIGYSLWQRRFLGDPRIVGRIVRIGIEQTTIVGVMPEEFAFPVAHQVWMPLRRQTLNSTREAPPLVFGRLASGVTHDEASAELTAIGQRMAADAPDTHEFLRPEIVPYAHLIVDPRSFGIGIALANVFLIVLMVVVFANVALLMFARASSREVEIGVRNALGASRARIVTQMFTEAIALSALSAMVGLFAARYGLGSLWRTIEADSGRALAFWVNDRLTPSTVAYGVGLTVLAAVIVGVLPAVKATGRSLQAQLRYSSGRGSGYRFGGVWTAVIAAQVAVTVMFPAAAFFFHRWVVAGQTRDVGFPAGQYLSARLVMDPVSAPVAGTSASTIGRRTAATIEELRTRLDAEPDVTAVTFADALPGMQHSGARFEVEGDDAPPSYGYAAGIAFVDPEFFGALGVRLLSGRGFAPLDVGSGREVAIVNVSFVDRVVHGRNPVGRRVRRAARDNEQPGPWIEIVGVVRDLGVVGNDDVGLYRPWTPGATTQRVAVHVAGAPEAMADRLRALASSVDPTLRVYDVMPLDQVGADGWIESQYLSRLLAVLSGIALMLSLMAIYAVMAFTVVQRTREIGTRVALGADRWRVITFVIRRPLVQIGLGIGVGGALVLLIFVGMFQSAPTLLEAGLIAAYATMMLAVCLSACLVPTGRALRLEPSQVLRADAS